MRMGERKFVRTVLRIGPLTARYDCYFRFDLFIIILTNFRDKIINQNIEISKEIRLCHFDFCDKR